MATIYPYSVIASLVVSGGTGYVVGDVLTLADGSVGVHSAAAQVTVAGVSSGVVTAVALTTLGNYSYQPTTPVSVTGGSGTGCTLNPTWATLYALPVDLQQRYDPREIGDLISDSGEQISAVDQVTLGTTPNKILLQILADACGDVDSSLMAAGRYANTDLYGLTGNSLSQLKRIVCELAIAYVFERKPTYNSPRMEQYSKSKAAHLDRLGSGVNIFNLPLVVLAGQPQDAGPSVIDYATNLNLLTDRVRTYPARPLTFGR